MSLACAPEGDESDTAFFDKGPKFLHYRPNTAMITSVEFDHADIYRDLNHVKESFRKLVGVLPADGCLVARWDHDDVMDVARDAGCELRRYGVGLQWYGRIEGGDTERGVPRHITVLDDFAHHPTAVKLTLESLRLRFGKRRMWVIFEPRSATSRRKVFQDAYAEAFGAADVVIVAHPHDQGRIAEGERFDSRELVHALRAHGQEAFGYDTVEEIVAVVGANALPWDVVAVLSNGGFGGIHGKLITALGGVGPLGAPPAAARVFRGRCAPSRASCAGSNAGAVRATGPPLALRVALQPRWPGCGFSLAGWSRRSSRLPSIRSRLRG